jgi:hypothetical protein
MDVTLDLSLLMDVTLDLSSLESLVEGMASIQKLVQRRFAPSSGDSKAGCAPTADRI